MEKFTLLELHLDGDTSFSPSIARGSSDEEGGVMEDLGTDSDMESEWDADMDEESESSGMGSLGVVFGLIAIAVVAAGVRRLMSDGGEADEYEPEMVEIEE